MKTDATATAPPWVKPMISRARGVVGLSPRLRARTIELNGGVAFGSALAGGAMSGPTGAFMSLPVAAMITSFVKSYTPRYALAYQSPYDDTDDAEDDAAAPEQ